MRRTVFTIGSTGKGDGVIVHTTNALVSAANPARAGEIVTVYATGLGAVQSVVPTGSAAASSDQTTNPVTVTVGGANAPVQYAGLTPGSVGLYQINIVIPPVQIAGSVGILVQVGANNLSQNGVTIPVAP